MISVGPGLRSNEGKTIPPSVKEGDTVLLPEYGGTQVKLADKEYDRFSLDSVLQISFVYFHAIYLLYIWWVLYRFYLYRDEDILGTLHE